MPDFVFHSPRSAYKSEVVDYSSKISVEEFAELLILPLARRASPLSYAIAETYDWPTGPLKALECWLRDPNAGRIVADSRTLAPEMLFDNPGDADAILSVLSHLERLKGLVNTESIELWLAAKQLVYRELSEALSRVDKSTRRAVFDVLATQDEIPVDWQSVQLSANAAAFVFIFAPFTDTGATVTAKRMRQTGDIFDVYSSNQEGRKSLDPSVERISNPYIDCHHELNVDPSWATHAGIIGFARKASRALRTNIESGKAYDYMYSRAMWVHGIYAGAAAKEELTDLEWIVEFSDPLSLGVSGEERKGPNATGDFFEGLLSPILYEFNIEEAEDLSVFAAAELVAYARADKLIFTNELQKAIMLARIPSPELLQRVEERAFVSNHPTLSEPYYNAVPKTYAVDNRDLNLAYFGEFYSNRGLQEITAAIKELPCDLRTRVHLHVFTDFVPAGQSRSHARNLPQKQFNELAKRTTEGVAADGLEDQIHVNDSLPYLEFLAVTKFFDYLVVTDARTTDHHKVNPYLPSKWSDYKGSAAATWALVESESSLSKTTAELITDINDRHEIFSSLQGIVRDKINSSPESQRVPQGTKVQGGTEGAYSYLFPAVTQDSYLDDIDQGSSKYQRAQRFIRTYPQLPRFVKRFTPAKPRGSIYSPNPIRALVLIAPRDEWHQQLSPRLAVSALGIQEPFESERFGPLVRTLSYPYQLEAPLAVSYLAMGISARARDVEASQIIVPLRPICGIAGLIAARRLGIPLKVAIEEPQEATLILNSSQLDRASNPFLDLLFQLLTHADDFHVDRDTAAKGYNFKLSSALSPISSTSTPSTHLNKANVTLAYIGLGIFRNTFASISCLSAVNDLEIVQNLVPDVLILDLYQDCEETEEFRLPQIMQDLSKFETQLHTLRKAGITVAVILPNLTHFPQSLSKILHVTDVVSHPNLEKQSSYFSSAKVTPKVFVSTATSTQVSPNRTATFFNQWDRFASQVLTGEPAVPPDTAGYGWNSSFTADRRIKLSRYILGESHSTPAELAWEGLCELSQGHTAIDYGIYLLRASGLRIAHPRALSTDTADKEHELFYRATGVLPDSFRSTGTVTEFDLGEAKFTSSPPMIERNSSQLPTVNRRGVSLILPTYNGAGRISRMLDSIADQSLQAPLIEIIVVPNGPSDGTEKVVAEWSRIHPQFSVQIEKLNTPGVSAARNAGLALATREYVTFVDDDDFLEPNYLRSLLVRADKDIVVLGKLNDVFTSSNGSERVDTDTTMNKRVRAAGRTVRPLVRSWNALSMNAAKLIPAAAAKSVAYDTSLQSGEDQVYLVQLLQFGLKVTGARVMQDDGYMRVHRPGTISRRTASFQFSVIERLEAMAKFRDISERAQNNSLTFAAKNLARWHAIAVVRYAETQLDNKNELQRIVTAIEEYGFRRHPEFRLFSKFM